ncbi:NACHT domain-containing protein [Saccharothrix carnea]|uniref:NACHT domain-containing protein n=1 Tax=Saccharothrix carnea TaxID=1280637 RepID=UPI001C632876|nr:NACHT domain-containing protein [Saccharothrix carnea]
MKAVLGGLTFQGLLHELVAARLTGMSEQTVRGVRENVQLATRLEFPQADGDKMMEFGGVLFDELDRVVRDLVGTLEGEQGKGLAEIRQGAAVALLSTGADSIRRHNAHLKRTETLAEAAAALDWQADYRNQINTAHGYIEPPDFERKRKVPIGSLFVSPRIAARDHESPVGDATSLRQAIDRSVLLGDPGGGKSTISNLFAWQSANEADGLVPFVVVLRNFVDNEQSVLDYIEFRLASHYQCPAPPAVVEGLLLSGRALVVFDGLDELLDTSRRREITNRVELFCARYPLTKVLVTSRRIGYEEAAMDPDVFDVYELAEFSDDNVAKYVGNWFVHVDRTDEQRARALAESFVQESAAVHELRKNPLMLALMCIIYRGQNWIPRNRPEMYEHCAKLLFEKWDSSRQIYVELKASAYVDGAIKQLAYWMFTDEAATSGVTESELVREAVTFLEPAFHSRVEAEQAARQFIDFCRGRGWVLTDVGTTAEGETLFAFMHRTFMEYFAAYELTRRHDGPEAVAKAILPRVAAAEWEVVAELTVQISNKHSRDGAARILTTLLDAKRFRSAVSRRNVTSFALRCLGFIHAPVPLATRIGQAFAESLVRFSAEHRTIILENFSPLPELQQAVENGISTALERALQSDRTTDREVAREVIIDLHRMLTGNPHSEIDPNDPDKWAALRRLLFSKHSAAILGEQHPTIWFAAWRQGLISLEELVTSGPSTIGFPLDTLFQDKLYKYLPGGWVDWGSFIPIQLLMADLDTRENFPVTEDELDWLGGFIDQLGAPPWVSATSVIDQTPGAEGELLVEEFPSDAGWTLVRLMLIGIEAAGSQFHLQRYNLKSRAYGSALVMLAQRREMGAELPGWLADAIDSMAPDRRELVWAWLNREVDFVQRPV